MVFHGRYSGVFCRQFDICTAYLMDFGIDEGYRDHIPMEIYELYIILLPFYCFISAVESRACGLSSIVPLSRSLLATLRDVLQHIRTPP